MQGARLIRNILENTSLIFLLSILLGMTISGPAQRTESLITPALLVMMSFSLTEIDLRTKGDLRQAFVGFALNYILLSGLILLLSFTLQNDALRYGFVVMAAVPPAVAVLPMTRLLGGDVRLSLYGEAISYLASLVLMPGLIFLFTSKTGVALGYVFEIALLMILLPALASRLLRRIKLNSILPINLGFFVVTYTVVGLNSGAILGGVAGVALIALIRTFVIGAAVYIVSSIAGIAPPSRISYTLFSSYKNLGLAAAVAIVLFGPEAGVPAAVCILAETGFYILLAWACNRCNRARLK